MKWLWIVTILFQPTANARWLKIEEAPSVVLKYGLETYVRKDGTYDQDVTYVTKVQSEDAKVTAGVYNIEYNSGNEEVEVLEAFTRTKGKNFAVAKAAIEDRDKGEARDYDPIRVRTIVYPQVEIGSEIHLKYRVKAKKAVIKDRWSFYWPFMPSVHVKELFGKIRSEIPLYIEVRDPNKFLRVKHSGKTVEFKNRKTLPGWVHAEKEVFFHPARFSEIWISTEKDWPKYLSGIEQDYEKIMAVGVPKKLKGWVAQAKKRKTAEEKILFTLEKMSESFRYFGDWRRHDGGYTPRPIAEIEASRYGDCKDLSALLVALLREMGIDADLALVRRGENPWGEEPDYKLANVYRFNHAIVRAKVGSRSYWLDPTNPVASLKPLPDIAGRPAWVMSPNGGAFERLPAARPENFDHLHTYVYHFGDDDTVKVNVKALWRDMAAYRMANDLMLSSKSEVLTGTLDYFADGAEVLKFDFKKQPKTTRALKDMDMDLEYTAGRVTYNAGKAMFWVIPDGVFTGPFFETENRESDLRLHEIPFTFRNSRRLVATRLAQEAPPTCRVQSKWMNMERKVRSEGEDVLIEQHFDLKRPYITRDEFRSPEFRKLQGEAKRCFHRTGVLIQSRHG